MIYTPQSSDRSESAKGTIVLLTDRYSDYLKQLSDPLRVLLNNAGYGLTILLGGPIRGETFNTSVRDSSDVVYDIIKTVDVQGMIVVAPSVCRQINSDQILKFMDEFGNTPSVCLGANVPGLDSLVIDNAKGMTECMGYLINSPENENFMFIGGRVDNADSIEREDVFRNSLASAGKTIDEELVIYSDFMVTKTYHAVSELIPKRPDVDVIVCANDDIAVGAIYALKSLNISVPNDIRVCGFDDAIDATSEQPTISSVTQPFAEIAEIAAELLIRKIEGCQTPAKLETIRTEFIQRESTRCSSAHTPRLVVPESDLGRVCQELSDSIISRIRLPRMLSSVEHDDLKEALIEAAQGDSVLFERCVTTFLSLSKLSKHDIHWWQQLVVAIEDKSYELPSSVCKDDLQQSLAVEVQRIRNAMHNWRDRRKFQKNRCEQLNAQLLANISNAKSVGSITTHVEDWLNHLQIKRCFFALYPEYSDSFKDNARLLINRTQDRSPLPSDKELFNTCELLPKSLQHHLKTGILLLLPIHSGGIQFGYMLIDPSDVGYFDHEYNAIGERLGNALLHIRQVNKLRKHADELEKVNRDLSSLANFDELTKLPNRAFFHHSLNQMISISDSDSNAFAVLFIDLDGFKFVNDSLGHSAGDSLLQIVAARIASALSDKGLIARLGGDEFTVVIEAENDLVEEAKHASNEILEAISAPFELQQNMVNVSASIGVALYPTHAKDMETLIRKADTAMYHAKASGKDCFQLYTPDFERELSWRVELDQKMRNGFQNNDFHLVYQPKYRLSDSAIVGFEALLRWNPDNPLAVNISSKEFIRIAEQTGFIAQLDHFSLLEACAAIKRLGETQVKLPISVNVSALQLHRSEFVDLVASCIREHSIDPQLLDIEITESAAMKDIELSILQITRLKNLGLTVSIDDFGIGHSSLNYLKHLPVDALRIGKSFLQEIRADRHESDPDVAIMQAIITLGRTMNFKVTAEGVENEAQMMLLRQLGCEEGQGFYFSPPVLENELRKKLDDASVGRVA